MNVISAKAILIILVIFDHSNYSRLYFDDLLYGFSFHVIGFYALYFYSAAEKNITVRELLSKHVVRYGYPYLIMLITLSGVFMFIEDRNYSEHVVTMLKAFYTGNHNYLKQSANIYLLWFLPSFLSFVFLERIYRWGVNKSKETTIISLCIIFICIPFLPVNVVTFFPLGLLTSLYILFIVVVIDYLYFKVLAGISALHKILGIFSLFVPVKYLQIHSNSFQEVGFLEVQNILNINSFLLNFLESVLGVMFVFSVSIFALGKLLNLVGKYSLQVYLSHIFIALFVEKFIVSFGQPMNIWLVGVCVLSTATLASALSYLIMKSEFGSRYIFPGDIKILMGRRGDKFKG